MAKEKGIQKIQGEGAWAEGSRRESSPRRKAAAAFLNRFSLLFHALLACGICFLIEWVSRHSFVEACQFVVDRNLVFLYNALIVFASLMLAYTVKRRTVMRIFVSFFWLFLGLINGCILAKRVSPFSFTDIKMVGDLFTMQSNYFTNTEAAMVIAGVSLVVVFLVALWFKGPKYQGKTHRLMGFAATALVALMIPGVTDAAVSSNILTDYFENLAQGYKDYGFVYSFSSSVLDRGMSTPENYSEESVASVLAKLQDDGGAEAESSDAAVQDTARADAEGSDVAVQDTARAEAEGSDAAVQDTAWADAEGSDVAVQDTAWADAEESGDFGQDAALCQDGGREPEQDGAQLLPAQGFCRTAAGEPAKRKDAGADAPGEEKTEEAEGLAGGSDSEAHSPGEEKPEETEGLAGGSDSGAVAPEEEKPELGQPAAGIGTEELNTDTPTSGTEIPEEGEAEQEYPNIICILLESFVDPEQINFLEMDGEAVPNFRCLYDNYTSGYLEVPVVGAGTANTEFEVLTGMGMQFFGLGEYPYKTVLKETNCESIASDLHALGYGTHVVHNNGGNFYSRRNAFSMMGFDTFTSKELMDIHDYTPIGTWPTDDILVGEVEKALDYTPDQPDFVYTITVEGHGDYPREKVLEDPAIHVAGVEDEGMANAWEYYVNMMHEVDDFIGDLIEMLSERDEKTFVVMFGDHLPTMNLTEEDMATGSLFKTQYATWNNFGLEKQDSDMTSYQLLADMTKLLGIEKGTMFTFHQNRDKFASQEEYQESMELLQYDILYGEHYVYGGENPYPASDLVMGTQEVSISQIMETDQFYYVLGENFTKWSKIYIDGEKIGTTYLSDKLLRFKKTKMKEGWNSIVVSQVGSSDTIFRSSNTKRYYRAPEEEEAG